MSKQQTASLAVVSAEAPLSPARQSLVSAMQRRQEAQEELQEVVKQHQRVESLGANTPAVRARIEELEAHHAALIEQWMLTEGAPHPQLPHVAEIERLRAELAQAEVVATSAKSALARVNEQMTACQRDVAEATEGVRVAADGVLVEIAAELAAELEQTERRAALVRGQLTALRRHFELEGMRRRPVAEAAAAVARMIPRGPYELAPPSIELAVSKWSDLASQLFNNENARLEIKS